MFDLVFEYSSYSYLAGTLYILVLSGTLSADSLNHLYIKYPKNLVVRFKLLAINRWQMGVTVTLPYVNTIESRENSKFRVNQRYCLE